MIVMPQLKSNVISDSRLIPEIKKMQEKLNTVIYKAQVLFEREPPPPPRRGRVGVGVNDIMALYPPPPAPPAKGGGQI